MTMCVITGDVNQSRHTDPSYLIRDLDRSRVDLALLDAHAPGTVRRRKGKGIEPFEEFLISIGWSEEKAGCSVYLVDDKFQEIPDAITAQLIAAYAADRVAKGLDPSVHLQALRDAFVSVGRDVSCFLNPLVSAARKARTRHESRDDARVRLGRQKEPVTEDMIWWGIHKFLPGTLDLTKASAKQSDEAMAMLAGLITYHWPAVRLSNQACTVSKKQAASYTSDWKEACDKAGTPFDEGTATDRFLKAHSFRVGDVIIGVKSQDNEERCMDPITWVTTEARSNPVPDTVTMVVMSAKKAQNGNRPISRTAVAS